jgi:DNA/RNA-binding domain of Phe-tRNA-synthetase-like protein
MKTSLVFSLPPTNLRIGLIEALDICVKPSSEKYQHQIIRETAPFLSPDYIFPDHIQKGIRSLLKTTGFHPSGRSRPASEFLLKDLQNRRQFNFINNIVDINNHLSLLSHLPISAMDLDKSGSELCIRVGLDDENYVFNREGQILSLKKLMVVARHGSDRSAIGSPVKDSQATKLFTESKNAVIIIYTSANITPENELNKLIQQFSRLLQEECGAKKVSGCILDA